MPHSRFCRPRGWTAAALTVLVLAACGRGSGDAPASGAGAPAASLPASGAGGPAASLPASGSRTDSAAAPAADSIVINDDAGRRVTLAAPARRIVSLVPAQTGIILRLAGPGVLVARTAWDTQPELAALPHTENALSPSVEWLAALRPDLVVAWPDRDARTVMARLGALGIPVYGAGAETLADIDSSIARLGVLLGVPARADSLRAALRAELDAVRARVAGAARPAVLYALSIDPPMVASNATYLGELVELAGGRNLFGDLRTLWPQVSLEEIVRRAPEVIVRPVEQLSADVLGELRGRPGWRDLPAVRAGRVHAVDVNLLNRPGAEAGEAARVLARAIHPELFAGQR